MLNRLRVSLAMSLVVALTCLPSIGSGRENPEAFTRVAENGYCPFWSPDGSFIVYGSSGSDAYEVWTVSLSDKKTRQLTRGGGFHPSVSPDGKYITYDDRGAHGRIHRMAISGGEPKLITPETMEGNFSHWSPDGARILFSSRGDIWSIPSEGGEASRIVSRETHDIRPAFSPDGNVVAFDSSDPDQGGNIDIWLYDIVEKSYSRLTTDPGKDIHPHWSPDGSMIAFVSEKGGSKDIWIMRIDGTAAVQVTLDGTVDVWPRWAPDGRALAFGSDRSGSLDVWIVDLEKQLGENFFKTN